MMPLLTALFEALAAACNAYVKRAEWEMKTHKERTLNELEDEKLRLADDGSPAAKLRLEIIAKRIARVE